jgi:hypothetical protein
VAFWWHVSVVGRSKLDSGDFDALLHRATISKKQHGDFGAFFVEQVARYGGHTLASPLALRGTWYFESDHDGFGAELLWGVIRAGGVVHASVVRNAIEHFHQCRQPTARIVFGSADRSSYSVFCEYERGWIYLFAEAEDMMANEVTGAKAGGASRLHIGALRAARIAQFKRWAAA